MTTVSINHYGVSGSGRNVTEAKRDAGKRIARIIRNLSPKIYSHRGTSVVITPNEHGTEYALIHPDSDGLTIGCTCGSEDIQAVTEGAITHLLSITREEGEFSIPEWVPKSMHDGLVSEWNRSDAFQRAYRFAEGEGDNNPHTFACMNADNFQLA